MSIPDVGAVCVPAAQLGERPVPSLSTGLTLTDSLCRRRKPISLADVGTVACTQQHGRVAEC